MLICESCGSVFSASDLARRTGPDEADLCPACKDDNISGAEKCHRCGEVKSVVMNEHLLIDKICDACLIKCVAQYNELIESLPEDTYETLSDVFGNLKLTA